MKLRSTINFKQRRNVVLLSSMLVLVLALAGVTAHSYSKLSAEPARSSANPLPVKVVNADLQSGYTVTREFVGRVEAHRESDIGFELDGLVRSIRVDDGDSVEKGQILAELDTDLLRVKRMELVAIRNQARAALNLAKGTRDRVFAASEMNAVSSQQWDEASRDFAAKSAAYAQARAAIKRIDVRLAKSQLTAPYSALIAERFVDEGQVIAAGTPIFKVLEDAHPEVRIGVAGSAVTQLARSQTYRVWVGNRNIPATLRSVLPTRKLGTRSVEVVLSLQAKFDGIRSGDLARLKTNYRVNQPGFWVPLKALTASSRGLWAVYVVDVLHGTQGILRRRELELLYQQTDRAFVRGGLTGGEMIVTAGLHRLVPNQPVKIAGDLVSQG